MSEARTPPHEKPGAKSKLFAKYRRSLRREKAAHRAALAARRGQKEAMRKEEAALRREKALEGDVARLTAEIEHLRRMHAHDGDTPAPPPSC